MNTTYYCIDGWESDDLIQGMLDPREAFETWMRREAKWSDLDMVAMASVAALTTIVAGTGFRLLEYVECGADDCDYKGWIIYGPRAGDVVEVLQSNDCIPPLRGPGHDDVDLIEVYFSNVVAKNLKDERTVRQDVYRDKLIELVDLYDQDPDDFYLKLLVPHEKQLVELFPHVDKVKRILNDIDRWKGSRSRSSS